MTKPSTCSSDVFLLSFNYSMEESLWRSGGCRFQTRKRGDMNKASLKVKLGDEVFISNGRATDHRLVDFWRWSVSDLVSNATRGRLAEFIVATALGVDMTHAREEWHPFDLLTDNGVRVEVKSASFVQSWNQKKLSRISFSIKPTRYWNSDTNKQSKRPRLNADVYVFCLLKHRDKATIDPLQLDQWEFYVLSRAEIKDYKRSQHSIILKSLSNLTGAIRYDSLKEAVFEKSGQ